MSPGGTPAEAGLVREARKVKEKETSALKSFDPPAR
jgi:hypothetical protein